MSRDSQRRQRLCSYCAPENASTTLAELAHHGATGTHAIRFSVNQKAVRLLDLTDPVAARQYGYAGGPITWQTKALGERALSNGYNAIKFPSLRGQGSNSAVLNDFDQILTPQMIVPTP